MEKKDLLELATNRFKNKNRFTDKDYKLPMDEFIIRMYLNCDPASYGRQFVKKIMRDDYSAIDGYRNLFYVKDKAEMGDLVQMYPTVEFFTGIIYDRKRNKEVSWDNTSKNTFEVKISYLTKTGNYNIRNIRPYQDFDYFILCFVDCENDFTPRFLLLKQQIVISDNYLLTLTPMSGTKKSNMKNKDIGYGATFKKKSLTEGSLRRHNLLKGETYEDLIDFLKTNMDFLEKNYEKSLKVKV